MNRASRSSARAIGPSVRRGVSLLEAVAALAIVGATSASILATTGAGVRAAERARRAHEAAALADETLARIHLLDDAALRVLPDSIAAGTFTEPFDDFEWAATVIPDARTRGLFSVTVTVQWDGGVQSLHSALYRRPPLSDAQARGSTP